MTIRYQVLLIFFAATLHAQSKPTATKLLELYTFAAGTGTFTGLDGGRNFGISAGAGVQTLPFRGLYPALEIRGSYSLDSGSVVGQKSILAGLKVAKHYHELRPYADFLIGRGELDYQNGGFPNPDRTFQYLQSSSVVLSPGLGLEYPLSHKFLLRFDGQYQRYQAPVTLSGHLYAKPLSAGLVYTFK